MENAANGRTNNAPICSSLFGSTDIAGGIPSAYRPSPSNGPVYFQGKLILSLSFQGKPATSANANSIGGANEAKSTNALNASKSAAEAANTPSPTAAAENSAASKMKSGTANAKDTHISRMRLWDELSDAWFPESPILERRCITGTSVTSTSATNAGAADTVTVNGEIVYAGSVDNAKEIVLVPGWNAACTAINNSVCLRWKECPPQ